MALRPPPPFKLGQKQIFLPNFIVSMVAPIRQQPANYVNFRVPLSFNKFDLRDYLHNLYGVDALAVRSWVRNSRPTRKGATGRGKWYRPQAEKYMSIRLGSPFVVPEKPKDLGPWDGELFKGMKKEQDIKLKSQRLGMRSPPGASQRVRTQNQRKPWDILPLPTMSQQLVQDHVKVRARAMQRGEEAWENGVNLDPKWEGIMEKNKARQEARKRLEVVKPPAATAKKHKKEAKKV